MTERRFGDTFSDVACKVKSQERGFGRGRTKAWIESVDWCADSDAQIESGRRKRLHYRPPPQPPPDPCPTSRRAYYGTRHKFS